MGLSKEQMQSYTQSSAASQPSWTKGKSTAEIQGQALASDQSTSMKIGRTGMYFVPGLGTAYAAAEAVGGAQTGDANKALLNSVAAVLPMGIGAAAKIASKAAPKTTAKVTAATDKVAAKINTKIIQPINSKVTSVIADRNVAADAAQKIVTDKSAAIRATDKAASNLVKQERKAQSPKAAVREAEDILKSTDRGTPPAGGAAATAPSRGRPSGPTLNYGPTGGVSSKKTPGVLRTEYSGAGTMRGYTQGTSGGRALSTAQSARANSAQARSLRAVSGETRAGQSVGTMIREAEKVTDFGTVVRKSDVQTTPWSAPTKGKDYPGVAPRKDPSLAPKRTSTQPKTTPGTLPPKSSGSSTPVRSNAGAVSPTPTAKAGTTTRTSKPPVTALRPKPETTKTKPPTKVSTPRRQPPKKPPVRPTIPPVGLGKSEVGAVQSNWQDYRR
jgi:hypothetical protein